MPSSTLASDPPGLAELPLPRLLEQAQALQQAGQVAEAADLYGRWIAASDSPLRHAACFNQGTLLSSLEREGEAEAAYRAALEIQPGFAQARLNLGHLLERRGETEAALEQWRAVIDSPATPDLRLHALNNLGRLLETLRRFPEAEAALRSSLELDARQSDVIQHFVHLRQKQCAWPALHSVGEVSPNMRLQGMSLLATMSETDDPALQLLAATRFNQAKVFNAQTPAPAQALHATMPARSGKLRIGYLSGDLHMHAVGLLVPELLELHDRTRFEVWGFCWTPESNQPQRQLLLAALDHHVRLAGVNDETAARLIAEAGIDVLVDLQGLTSGARPAILGSARRRCR